MRPWIADDIEARVALLRDRLGDWRPPSNDQWASLANPHAVTVRIAWLTVHQPADECASIASDPSIGPDVLSKFAATESFFADLAHLCSMAAARLEQTRSITTAG